MKKSNDLDELTYDYKPTEQELRKIKDACRLHIKHCTPKTWRLILGTIVLIILGACILLLNDNPFILLPLQYIHIIYTLYTASQMKAYDDAIYDVITEKFTIAKISPNEYDEIIRRGKYKESCIIYMKNGKQYSFYHTDLYSYEHTTLYVIRLNKRYNIKANVWCSNIDKHNINYMLLQF